MRLGEARARVVEPVPAAAAEKADEEAAEEGAARSGRARESSREETGPDAPGGNQVRVMEPAVGDGG